jgi:hypothetical protein
MTYFYRITDDLFFPGRIYWIYDKNQSIIPDKYFSGTNILWWVVKDDNGSITENIGNGNN